MYNGLLHAHSGLRWILLLLLVAAVVNALIKWQKSQAYTAGDRKIGLFAMVFTHIQLVLGLILYFISPKVVFAAESMKVAALRFFLVEHITIMLIAVAVITIGHVKVKKTLDDESKFKKTFIWFLTGLVLILIGIPWPFYNYGAGWF